MFYISITVENNGRKMRIQNISIQNFKNNELSKQQNKNISLAKENKSLGVYPTTSQYIAFCGGLSLDLKHVNSVLADDEFPSNIKSKVEKSLENKEDNTLYDIHSDYYKGVLDCFSLDELKEKYPEFEGCKSVYDIEDTKTGSVIDSFLTGKSKTFSQDEDLTLQLIKLYWGQGFSLMDLSKYALENSTNDEGVNFYYTMTKKLNIPVQNRHYARILKLSNKEYNEKFTQEMAIKRLEAKEAKQQKLEGEPVVIPSKRELSEAHKKHISEGLKDYYQNNPETIYRQTKRQKEFYENNPQYKEKMSLVMDYAWNSTQEGKSVKKYLAKFMKKHGQISDEKLILQDELTKDEKTLLEQFWKINTWAKPKFSSAVKKGWEYAKDDLFELFDGKSVEGEKIVFNLLPTKVSKEIEKFAKEKGYKIPIHSYGKATVYKNDREKSKIARDFEQKSAQIADNYYSQQKNPLILDDLTTVKHVALMMFLYDLEHNSNKLPKELQNPDVREIYLTFINELHKKNPLYIDFQGYSKMPRPEMDTKEIDAYYSSIMMMALSFGHLELAEYMNNYIDVAYDEQQNGTLSNLFKYFK